MIMSSVRSNRTHRGRRRVYLKQKLLVKRHKIIKIKKEVYESLINEISRKKRVNSTIIKNCQ
jgi:hypothetical protein